MFADVDQPGHRPAAHPGVAPAVPRPSRRCRRPAPLLGTHTDEVLADVLGLSTAEIGRLHDDGARRVRRRGEPEDERAPSRSSPTPASPPEATDADLARPRPRSSPSCSTPTRRVLDGGALPRPWHWACFLPDAPTAALGPDGHPRRRAEMAAFPHRMWVGGRVRGACAARLDVDGHAARAASRRPSIRRAAPARSGW